MSTFRKKAPYRAAFAAIIVGLVVACSPAPTETLAADGGAASQTSLLAALEADRAFAAAVKAEGPKAAFLKYLAADGEFFEPGLVVKGAAAVAAGFDQAPPGFALEWAPDSGHASAAGDLAITTGRYNVKMDAALIDQGRYMTVWRKDAAGGLKVVMDSRQPDPPASPTAPPPEPDPNGRPG